MKGRGISGRAPRGCQAFTQVKPHRPAAPYDKSQGRPQPPPGPAPRITRAAGNRAAPWQGPHCEVPEGAAQPGHARLPGRHPGTSPALVRDRPPGRGPAAHAQDAGRAGHTERQAPLSGQSGGTAGTVTASALTCSAAGPLPRAAPGPGPSGPLTWPDGSAGSARRPAPPAAQPAARPGRRAGAGELQRPGQARRRPGIGYSPQ